MKESEVDRKCTFLVSSNTATSSPVDHQNSIYDELKWVPHVGSCI